jgi:PAS domain S-box-containing protein
VNRPVPGFSLGETLGRSFVEFLPPDHHDRFMSVLGQVFNGGRSVEYETPAFGPAGHLRWYHIRLSPVFVSEITENAILFATDITARKQAEEERRKLEVRIRHAQKLESLVSMAGGISHDFNNLLAIILGNAEIALSETPHGSPVRENLENIGKAVDRSVRLTKQMLAYSGKSVFSVEPVHLSSVVQNSLETVENSISPYCALKMRIDEDIPTLTGDATQLSQVLGNLLVNASESIGEQTGIIALSVTKRWCDQQWLAENFPLAPLPEGLYACIEVADTGCGIPSEAKDRIFEPFYSTKFTGRGLGLSTAQGIVRCHGGDIRAVSAPERGTIFQVLLPIA